MSLKLVVSYTHSKNQTLLFVAGDNVKRDKSQKLFSYFTSSSLNYAEWTFRKVYRIMLVG